MPCLVGLALGLLFPSLARAGEITVFLSSNSPREVWKTGQGAALTLGLLKVVQFEAEGARVASDAGDARMTYFTGSASAKLPFTHFTPYAGLGVGLYHQSQGDLWKIHALDAAFVGIRLRLADLIVLKGEYRTFALHGEPFLPLDNRISFGAGIAF
jgi:hypothetical protein